MTQLYKGSDSHDSGKSPYTTLTEVLGFDERDIARMAAATTRQQVTIDSIPTFVLGTVISTVDSTYDNTPIFNLKNLDEDSLLDLNPQSASRDDVGIEMTSNKNAATSSYNASLDSKTSASFAGLVSAGAAFHADHSQSLANSDGNIYVSMNRGKHGSYYEILAKDLKSGFDFTPYLIGHELSDTEVKSYVDYTEKRVHKSKVRYIDTLIFRGNHGYGQIDWSQRNVYGNVQLLTEMERLFGLLKNQYETFKGNKAVQDIVYTNMLTLKQKIGHAVKDFYAHVGTHFVSRLNFSNYAYGYGTLNFQERAGNKEGRLGAAVSLGGSIPSKASVESGTSASYAKQSGWASAMKNLAIEAHIRPAGPDIGSFAADIKSILDDESKLLSVPNLSVPTSPKVEVKAAPAVKKKSLKPPDSVFASYGEWKQYQKDLKDKSKRDDSIKVNSNKVDKKSTDALLLEDSPENSASATSLYAAYREERSSLKTPARPRDETVVANNSNIMRIEDMFVSGFETTAYESVLPSLRTSNIVLPKTAEQISNYPNATKLSLVINLFRQLADYINFMSKFTISNISGEFNDGVQDFHDQFSEQGYELVTDHMSRGEDISADLLHSFAVQMYGDRDGRDVESTVLYKSLDSDIDKFHYIKFLLDPELMYLWRDAPGGYAPFFFKDNTLRFAALHRLVDKKSPHENFKNCKFHSFVLETDLSIKVHDTPDIPLLYKKRTESPLYPIFRYELKSKSKLLFLQVAGRYQLVYGKNGLISPSYNFQTEFDKLFDVDLTHDTVAHVINDVQTGGTFHVDVIADMDDTVTNALMSKMEGFDIDKIDTEYALYFPEKTQTKELREENRVLHPYVDIPHLAITCEPSPDQYIPIAKGGYSNYIKKYLFTDLYTSLIHQYRKGGNSGDLVKVEDGSKKRVEAGFHVLLPIDYTNITVGYGSLLMGNAFGTADFIRSPTYDAAAITSLHS